LRRREEEEAVTVSWFGKQGLACSGQRLYYVLSVVDMVGSAAVNAAVYVFLAHSAVRRWAPAGGAAV
jgi:hypothetical protein